MSVTRDTHLSKTLSWLLRHGAKKENLIISSEGYININDVLNHISLKGKYTLDDIKRVVDTNSKQRFSLRHRNNILEICANQGHSLQSVDQINVIPILNYDGIAAIHGTYYKNWRNIKREGLSRMKRNHIHFATDLPDNKNIISGMRKTAEVFISININLALSDEIRFYKSVNGVILSPGNEQGIIAPKYFLKVWDINGKSLL